MRLWVRSEYAPVLAALCAWLAALAPWAVTLTDPITLLGSEGRLLFVRFPLFELQYNLGLPMVDAVTVDHVYGAYRDNVGSSQETAHALWLGGAVLAVASLALGTATYAAADRVAAVVDPVRAIGAVLVLSGVVNAAATYEFATTGLGGTPLPVGTVLQLAFGGVLLAVERREVFEDPG